MFGFRKRLSIVLAARTSGRLATPVATRGYLVLGMHRSGTSCLTGLLETAGLWLGEVSRRNESNSKGNLENQSIQGVNALILAKFGGSWDAPPAAIARVAIDQQLIWAALEPYRQYSQWLVKDPRMVLTLEAWLPHLATYHLIGSFRHPAAVARSLAARNGMPMKQGMALWVHYNRRLLERHQQHDFPLISFDLPRGQYMAQFRALCGRMALPHAAAAAAAFYDPEAVHHEAEDEDEVALSPDASQIYRELWGRRLAPELSVGSPLRKAG